MHQRHRELVAQRGVLQRELGPVLDDELEHVHEVLEIRHPGMPSLSRDAQANTRHGARKPVDADTGSRNRVFGNHAPFLRTSGVPWGFL